MLKKIIAASLAVILAFACFGCTESQKTIKADAKIALIVGSEAAEPDLFKKAAEIKALYGENVIIHSYADNYCKDAEAVSTASCTVAEDTNVKAIVFANAVDGTASAIKKIRQNRNDIGIIVCNPVEGIANVSEYADVVVSIDYDSAATAMVDNAVSTGVKTFVFYTFTRQLKYGYVKSMYDIIEKACKEKDIVFKGTASVDAFDDERTVEIAKTYIGEDMARKFEKYSSETAVFTSDALVQDTLAEKALEHDMMLASPADFSPFSCARAAGVDITGKETDAANALAQTTALLNTNEEKGTLYSWTFSPKIAMLEAGFEYAYEFGKAKDAASFDKDAAIKESYKTVMGETEYTLTPYADKDDASIDNVYLLNGVFYKY